MDAVSNELLRRKPPTMFAYATYFLLVYGLVCWLVGKRIAQNEIREWG